MSAGAAVPGTSVPSGSLVTPGGPQGIQGLQGAQGPVNIGFIAKSTAYTIQNADKGLYFICAGGNWTLTLPAPANGFYFWVRNDQGITGTTGTITLSPPSGTIDGAATLALLPGQQCMVACNGTNWRTFELQRVVVIGTIDIAAPVASQVILLPLGYRLFEIELTSFAPVTDAVVLRAQFSTNGGSSWISSGYFTGNVYSPSTATVAYSAVNSAGDGPVSAPMASGGNNAGQVKLTVSPGTAARVATYLTHSMGFNTGPSFTMEYIVAGSTSAGLINAMNLYYSSGNIATGSITVKGIV